MVRFKSLRKSFKYKKELDFSIGYCLTSAFVRKSASFKKLVSRQERRLLNRSS